jgi:hypothetical protein
MPKATIPTTPSTPPTPSVPTPPVPTPPINKPPTSGGPTSPMPYPGGGYSGGVVVIAPDAAVGVPVVTGPVEVPVIHAPVVAPSATVGSAARAATSPQRLMQDPVCGGAQVPRLAAMLDELLSSGQFEAADLETVKALRLTIADLEAAGQRRAARAIEERAMAILGYAKLPSSCANGSFTWVRQAAVSE